MHDKAVLSNPVIGQLFSAYLQTYLAIALTSLNLLKIEPAAAEISLSHQNATSQ
ncbi:MAG: hypothetical protein HC769_36675 [Cyanobacteria bacterium CRU_2_1]|nr:hypothetical protein [Cyanobacteria bacterium CRU_2_1]